MTIYSVYLLQLMTSNDSLIHREFLILIFCHEYQETPHLALFTSSKSTMETPEQYMEYVPTIKTLDAGNKIIALFGKNPMWCKRSFNCFNADSRETFE